MKTLKIKINECNIKSLLLAFYFSKFNYEIYIYDPIKKNTSCDFDEKFFTITNSTKFILEELELWNKLQTKIYGFNSFSFINRFFNQEILISKIDMFNKDKHNENIGWILKYSDLKELLINKLSNNLNIKFLNSGFIQKKCDYEFHFEDFNEKKLLDEVNKIKFDDFQGTHWQPSLIPKTTWDKVNGFSEEFSPGLGSDPDFNMKLWNIGVRIFKGLGKCRVYHFSSISLRKKAWNNGAKTFLLKWGMSIKFFKKYYLKSDAPFKGPLTEPNKSIMFYLDLAKCKITYLFHLIISKRNA